MKTALGMPLSFLSPVMSATIGETEASSACAAPAPAAAILSQRIVQISELNHCSLICPDQIAEKNQNEGSILIPS